MLLRGAISIGEFVTKDNTVIGPAVADAAQWYENCNWIGIVATPKYGYAFQHFVESFSFKNPQILEVVNRYLVPYDVPLRNGNKNRMWSVAWPSTLFDKKKGRHEVSAKCAVSLSFSEFPIPLGTEIKYKNTMEFVDWYGEKISKCSLNKSHIN